MCVCVWGYGGSSFHQTTQYWTDGESPPGDKFSLYEDSLQLLHLTLLPSFPKCLLRLFPLSLTHSHILTFSLRHSLCLCNECNYYYLHCIINNWLKWALGVKVLRKEKSARESRKKETAHNKTWQKEQHQIINFGTILVVKEDSDGHLTNNQAKKGVCPHLISLFNSKFNYCQLDESLYWCSQVKAVLLSPHFT